MINPKYSRLIKISILCIIGAILNYVMSTLGLHVLHLPLFLDTIFNVAVTFTAGLIPGLATVVLFSAIGWTIRAGSISPFILCGIAEVLIVWLLKPAEPSDISRPADAFSVHIRTYARLMLLYIVAFLSISILGGTIDFIFYTLLPNTKQYYSAEDTFKIIFSQNNIPVLATNILSRIPVNVIDRFIVIFGGWFISRGVKKIL